jgi:hypothetical protein
MPLFVVGVQQALPPASPSAGVRFFLARRFVSGSAPRFCFDRFGSMAV